MSDAGLLLEIQAYMSEINCVRAMVGLLVSVFSTFMCLKISHSKPYQVNIKLNISNNVFLHFNTEIGHLCGCFRV